jgi:hypothetical protein
LAPLRAAASLLVAVIALAACGAGGDPVEPAPKLDTIGAADPSDTLFASVAVGREHSCALTRGGRAFCWGWGGQGQLGTHAPPPDCAGSCALTPVPVFGGLRFTQLAARDEVTCGLSSSGAVACWGRPVGSPVLSMPAALRGAPALRTIALTAGQDVCGLDAAGRPWCTAGWWGGNGSAGADTLRAVPGGVRFSTLGDECGTTAGGALYCWNGFVDTTVFDPGAVVLDRCNVGYRYTPEGVPCSPAAVRLRASVAMGQPARQSRDCALDAAGAAYCWSGARADLARMGLMRADTGAAGWLPERLPFPVPLVALFGDAGGPGAGGICGSDASGAVYCRGSGAYGLFGNGPGPAPAGPPVPAAGGMRFVSAAGSLTHMCGVTAAGVVHCWGAGRSGQLGVGGTGLEACDGLYYVGTQPCLTRPRRIASIAGR